MLPPRVSELAKGANYAVFSTSLPSGHPQTHVMWVDCDDEHVLINTLASRRKYRNILENPKVSVTIINGTDWFDWVEVRGTVVDTVQGEVARQHIHELSQLYFGTSFGGPDENRVILKIRPDRVVEHAPE